MRSHWATGPFCAFVLGAAVWALAPRVSAQALVPDDVVVTKDGEVFVGKIVSQDENAVVVKTTSGALETIPRSEIERVTLGKDAPPMPSSSLPPLPASPPVASSPPTSSAAPTTTAPASWATSAAPIATPAPPTAPPPASGDAAKPRGNFEIGARLAYGAPMGSVEKSAPLHDVVSFQMPIWLDAGYRFPSGLYLGAFLAIGFVKIKGGSPACPPGTDDCTGKDVRFGAQLAYHAASDHSVDPWFAIGFGRESFSYEATTTNAPRFASNLTGHVTLEGWNYLDLQLGIDFLVSRKVGLGPFASFVMGKYTDESSSVSGSFNVTQSRTIESTSDHQWVFFGARGTFGNF